jgi:hypothetical protein
MSHRSSSYPQCEPVTDTPVVHLLTRAGHISLCGVTNPPQAWTYPNWPHTPHTHACPACQDARLQPASRREREVA